MGRNPHDGRMEWSQPIFEWWNDNAVVISLVESGFLIVGGIVGSLAAWWHHRSLNGQIRSLKCQMKDQERTLLAAIEELTESLRNMAGRSAEEQRRIVAEAEKIAISATASFDSITASATLRKRPAGTEEEPRG